jgi:hypothetical protein
MSVQLEALARDRKPQRAPTPDELMTAIQAEMGARG